MLYINSITEEIDEFIEQLDDGVVFMKYDGRMIWVPLEVANTFKMAKGEYLEAVWCARTRPILNIEPTEHKVVLPPSENTQIFYGLSGSAGNEPSDRNQQTDREVLELARDWFESVIEKCSRLTTGNVSHMGATIQAFAKNCIEYIDIHFNVKH